MTTLMDIFNSNGIIVLFGSLFGFRNGTKLSEAIWPSNDLSNHYSFGLLSGITTSFFAYFCASQIPYPGKCLIPFIVSTQYIVDKIGE